MKFISDIHLNRGKRDRQNGASHRAPISSQPFIDDFSSLATASNTFSTTYHSTLSTSYPSKLQSVSQQCSRRRGRRPLWRCAVSNWHPNEEEKDKDREMTDTDALVIAKRTTALSTLRTANVAFISSSSSKPAEPTMGKPGIVKGNPGPPPAMSVVKDDTQVPLPSQEGTKGVVQYALYVHTPHIPQGQGYGN